VSEQSETSGGRTAYCKGTQGKDTNEDDLALQGQLGLEEDGHGNQDDHDIGRDVEDGVDNEMVCLGGALG
jgi:hypothetical protein